VRSSIGRAAVSKAAGWEFESLRICQASVAQPVERRLRKADVAGSTPAGVLGEDDGMAVDWHPMTRMWWDTWRGSAQAQTFLPTDWMFLIDTALLMATAAQIAEHVLTTGATGTRAWVVIIVSAVPPLVAAHVLHIDPPMDTADVDEVAQLPTPEPQTGAEEPATESAGNVPPAPENAPEPPILRSYAEVAEALNVAPETVRGWANNGTVKKYDGLTAHTRRVDLRECKTVQARRQLVGA
jgi:hypothetical protein